MPVNTRPRAQSYNGPARADAFRTVGKAGRGSACVAHRRPRNWERLLQRTNNSNGGGFSTGHIFQVTYEGDAAGGPSLVDTITVAALYDFETAVSPVTFDRDVLGAFGPGIASALGLAGIAIGGFRRPAGTACRAHQ